MRRRPAIVSGLFYPAESHLLRHQVNRLLDDSGVLSNAEHVLGIVTPHAGYEFSARTAASDYARVRGKRVNRVILMGRSHWFHFPGASIYAAGAFETPFGDFPVDEAFSSALSGRVGSESEEPHYREHSIEVQLPLLHAALGVVPIVPVLFGSDAGARHKEFGETLAEMIDANDLIVASTDLSHYLPEEEANAQDKASLDAILRQDCQALCAGLRSREYALCGAPAVVAAMACTLKAGASQWQLLDYRTSAEASGDRDRVVGYGAISMERPL